MIRRFFAHTPLSGEEIELLGSLRSPPIHYRAGELIRREDSDKPKLYFLLDGWVSSNAHVPSGDRQTLKVYLPGDVMGAPSIPYVRAVETLVALTDCTVSAFSVEALKAVFLQSSRLGYTFFLCAQEERVILMDRLTAIGRLDARSSMASLLIHLMERLAAARPGEREARLDVPLNQQQFADLLGLSVVHVNRVLRDFDRSGLIVRERYNYHLTDVAKLRELAGLPERRLLSAL